MPFINYRCPYSGEVSTEDHFETWAEARAMAREYSLVAPGYYLSQRSTREYREEMKAAANAH